MPSAAATDTCDNTGVAVDQPQRCGLFLREAQVGERGDEIPMHRRFRAPQPVAEEAVELLAHQARVVLEILRASAAFLPELRAIAAPVACHFVRSTNSMCHILICRDRCAPGPRHGDRRPIVSKTDSACLQRASTAGCLMFRSIEMA